MGRQRSNSKEVKEKIQSYIVECFEFEGTYNNVGEELQQVIRGFNKWWADHKHLQNQQEAFSNYLMCLPSDFTVAFQTYDIEQRLESWLGYSDRQYADDEQLRRFHWLIFRELTAMCRKHHVQF